MENNLENKERFFAQHWGQRIVEDKFWVQNEFYTVGYKHKLFANADSHIGGIEDKHLVLKPLSSISDEDSSSLRGFINKGDFLFYLRKCKNEYDFIDSNLSLENLDYLRSKGYALPWMGLSVEELVNRGWVKLKGETK